ACDQAAIHAGFQINDINRCRPMTAIAFPKPDPAIMARREAIIAGLRALLPVESVIEAEDERRAFETDAFTAYRRLPLAVALPSSTAEVSAVMRFCHQQGVG